MAELSQEPGLDPLLIIGLGNPGEKYAETRHNAGFWFLDQLVRQSGCSLKLQKKLHAETGKASLEGRECILARPTTFMNHSGMAVQAVAAYYRVEPENMLIAYDELDLAPGTARFKLGGGHGGHNGMRDVLQCAKSADFYRLRIGIGHPGMKEVVTPWVLSRASREQTELIKGAIGRALEAMPLFVRGKVAEAMKCLHTRAGADSESTGPDGSAP